MTWTNHNNTLSAAHAMHNYVITQNQELKQTKDYQTVAKIIFKLIEGGVTFAAKGYCISMSDIVYTLLQQNKIPCKIVECHLAITSKVKNEIYTVGFDGLKDDPNKADTHVVVITETEIPMVIDVSIAHLLPFNLQGVIDAIDTVDHGGIFANIAHESVDLTYQHKKQHSIPMLHQRSIVDRIQTDVKIFNNLRWLRWMIITAISISLLNASRGFYDFYQTYYVDDRTWGPRSVEKIIDKLDRIDQNIQNSSK